MNWLVRSSTLLVVAGVCLGVFAATGGGCSANGSNNGHDDDDTGSGGGISGSGGSGTLVGSGGGSGVGGGCAGISKSAEKAPLDMYIMLDQSGSMGDPPANGSGTKWSAVVGAIGTFVQQPEATGIGVGIQYFPIDTGASCNILNCTSDSQCGAGCGPCMMPIPGFGVCTGFGGADSCNPVDYANPSVEIGLLPGNANAIIQSMNAHAPTGGTPTSEALRGAINHSTSWANMNSGHVVIVVLATDGDPTSCDTNLANINAIAASGANASPQILTFVIGVGGSVGALNGIANAGGTGQAFMIDQDPNVQQAFLDALNAIQGQVLPCSYLIPQPAPGEVIDFGSVNVTYTPGGGGASEIIPKVNSAASCPANGKAWYYDDNANPTQIILCPSTCTVVTQDTMGSVDIVLGCETVVE